MPAAAPPPPAPAAPRFVYVLLIGDPFEGLQAVGPFKDGNEATDYAADQHNDNTWWWVLLEDGTNTQPEEGKPPQILISGNPRDGFIVTGPFGSPEEAIDHETDDDRWSMDLNAINESWLMTRYPERYDEENNGD